MGWEHLINSFDFQLKIIDWKGYEDEPQKYKGHRNFLKMLKLFKKKNNELSDYRNWNCESFF